MKRYEYCRLSCVCQRCISADYLSMGPRGFSDEAIAVWAAAVRTVYGGEGVAS